jgi:hypothetical protein
VRYFLDRALTVRRLHKNDSNRSAFSATGTAFNCSFQDPSPDRVQAIGGQIGKTYDVFVPDSSSNIKAGDEVVIGTKRYSVRAREVVDFGGTPYIALIVELQDNYA